MRNHNCSRRRAFTLVEMLVVIGIIVVLVALLVPMGSVAVSRARNFNMSGEISQLATAIEDYKNRMGDYPPSFGEIDASGTTLYLPATRYTTVVEKHLRKCYPNITTAEKDYFYNNIVLDGNGNPRLTGDEALVMWLSMTKNDERNPFTSSNATKNLYTFKEERLVDFDNDGVPSYKPTYSGETAYVYIDSRSYAMHRQAQYAIGGVVQAYWNDKPGAKANPASYMNHNTFQIICAGQDKQFGPPLDQFDSNNNILYPKRFKSGINYTDEDKDNLTNFSEGRRLEDHIP